MDKFKRIWSTKNPNDEWWSSFVTSPLAVVCNWLVVDIAWITPNLITLFSFTVALASAVFICLGSSEENLRTSFHVVAAILIHVSHILDCMDGQMARYRGTLSRSGSFSIRQLTTCKCSFGSAQLPTRVICRLNKM